MLGKTLDYRPMALSSRLPFQPHEPYEPNELGNVTFPPLLV